MEIIRQNRLIAAVLGGLVLMAVLVLIFNDDSSPSVPASDLPTRTPIAAGSLGTGATDPDLFTGPDIEQLECGPLLDFDDVDAALGTRDWLTISGGETCTHRHLDDTNLFVRIQPGHPTDLIDGGTLEGQPGQAVPGVGDAATWFPGQSTLSVAAEGRFGALVFRVTVSRAELDAPARLEAAKALALAALPRFPGIEVEPPPPPDPVVVGTDHPPVESPDQSYLANLLAREAAGDWTRGEGIIATLQLFAGETSTALVTPARTIRDGSGSEIVQLARGYLVADAAPDEQAEIERLLAVLLPPTEVRDAMSGQPIARALTGPATARALTGARPIAFTAQEPATGCQTYWGTDDPCMAEIVSTELDALFGDGNYKILAPAEGIANTAGWTDAHLGATIEAFERSAINFNARGKMPASLEILFTPLGFNPSNTLGDATDCLISVNTPLQGLFAQNPEVYKQWIASAVARCFARANFPASSLDDIRWWEPGYVWYLSDVIYPNASLEQSVLGLSGALEAEELPNAIPGRQISNIAFFESLDAQIGAARVDDVVRAIPAGLETYAQIGLLTHEFVKVLSDGIILDQGGSHDYAPDADEFELAEGLVILAEPQPFGVERLHLTVPAGKFACVEYQGKGDALDSWRPNGPGDGGSWGAAPATLEGESTLIATATEPGASLTLTVNELSDEDDCEDDEPTSPSTGSLDPPCGFCDPTKFFWAWTIAGLD